MYDPQAAPRSFGTSSALAWRPQLLFFAVSGLLGAGWPVNQTWRIWALSPVLFLLVPFWLAGASSASTQCPLLSTMACWRQWGLSAVLLGLSLALTGTYLL